MKITTWNVNGLRAALRKNAHHWWQDHGPDLLCLQEIRARPDQLTSQQRTDLGHDRTIWHPAQRAGYSGVAAVYQDPPRDFKIGLGISRFDAEGRALELHYPGVRIFNLYVPNGQRDLARLDFKLDFYRSLLDICDHHHAQGEKIILCGDFNTAHTPLDLRNPRENQSNTGFLPEERAWIDRFLEHGFVDIFRLLYPEKEEYTWWTYRNNARERNIGWRLDYFLISQELVPRVKNVTHHLEVFGSDHCPVTLELAES